jgi:hypothetical protein
MFGKKKNKNQTSEDSNPATGGKPEEIALEEIRKPNDIPSVGSDDEEAKIQIKSSSKKKKEVKKTKGKGKT